MSESADQQFDCPACGKAYRWQERLAGKKVRCKCGVALKLPAWMPGEVRIVEEDAYSPITNDDAENAPDDSAGRTGDRSSDQPGTDGGYDVEKPVDEGTPTQPAANADVPRFARRNKARCPSCGSNMKPHAVICLNCGHNRSTGKKIKTQRIEGDEDAPPIDGDVARHPSNVAIRTDRALTESNYAVREKTGPIVMIVVGVLGLVWNAMMLANVDSYNPYTQQTIPGTMQDRLQLLAYHGVELAVQFPFLFLAMLMVAKIFGTSFGYVTVALFKLVALSIISTAVWAIVGSFLAIITENLPVPGVGLVHFLVGWSFFAGVAMWLFDMDIGEACALGFFSFLLPILLLIVVFSMLL